MQITINKREDQTCAAPEGLPPGTVPEVVHQVSVHYINKAKTFPKLNQALVACPNKVLLECKPNLTSRLSYWADVEGKTNKNLADLYDLFAYECTWTYRQKNYRSQDLWLFKAAHRCSSWLNLLSGLCVCVHRLCFNDLFPVPLLHLLNWCFYYSYWYINFGDCT